MEKRRKKEEEKVTFQTRDVSRVFGYTHIIRDKNKTLFIKRSKPAVNSYEFVYIYCLSQLLLDFRYSVLNLVERIC